MSEFCTDCPSPFLFALCCCCFRRRCKQSGCRPFSVPLPPHLLKGVVHEALAGPGLPGQQLPHLDRAQRKGDRLRPVVPVFHIFMFCVTLVGWLIGCRLRRQRRVGGCTCATLAGACCTYACSFDSSVVRVPPCPQAWQRQRNPSSRDPCLARGESEGGGEGQRRF